MGAEEAIFVVDEMFILSEVMLVEAEGALDMSSVMAAMLKRLPTLPEEELIGDEDATVGIAATVLEDTTKSGATNTGSGCLVRWTRSMQALPAIAKRTTCTQPDIPPSKLA